MQYNACYMHSMQYDAVDIETQAGTRKKAMALELTILVGTMTGTAQLVAQELELTLDGGEIRVRTTPMDGLDASAGTMPEEVAVAWVAGWISLCRKEARLTA